MQDQEMAHLTWEMPNQVTLEANDQTIRDEIQALLDKGCQEGIYLRTGREEIVDGEKIYLEERLIIFPNDDRFLSAFSDWISSFPIAGQRLFGLVTTEG
jgi:hypothetical protein